MLYKILALFNFLLMIASGKAQLLPCSFNLMCTCSKPGPALGWVQCHQVTLISLPQELYNRTVYILSLKNNELRMLEKERFFIPGIWRLEIQYNFLSDIPSKVFLNTGKTLKELDLSHNILNTIPHQALMHLNTLQKLDLSYNRICDIHNNDLDGVKESLKILRLSGNSLTSLNPNSLNNFELLHTLDLSYNMINDINERLFEKGNYQLKYINLANNQLQKIPFSVLVHLKELQVLNLMNNRISVLSDSLFQGRLSLNELHLEYNDIKLLLPFSFQNFEFINKTFLMGNPIASISEDSFNGVYVKEIYLSNCEINTVSIKSFQGLEECIEILNLNSNNITLFPMAIINNLKKLKNLNIAENKISFVENSFQEIQGNLQSIDLSGEYMGHISFETFAGKHNLKQLAINGIMRSKLQKESFKGFAHGFEKLSLRNNELSEIDNDAFHYLPGLRHLDLSNNKIVKIQPMAFRDIGYSLETLDLHNALASKVTHFAFQHLYNLYHLDLSDNRLQSLPANMFAWMKNIRFITLSHNQIAEIEFHYFQHINNPHIIWIKFSFNMLKRLKQYTFHNLQNLTYLELNDNSIEYVEKFAFINLPCITKIQLQGNKIKILDTESFQNLPKLKTLNLAFNQLKILSLDIFDQVGILSILQLDVRYNRIQKIEENDTNWQPVCAIQALDFTRNNISYINPQYFYPVRNSLTHLLLNYNKFLNVSDTFSNLHHLVKLDIHNNKIKMLTEESLTELRSLLILNISHNRLSDIPADIFKETHNLEILDVSYNNLRGLPADVFKGTKLKLLGISNNKMIHFPDDAILSINNTLLHLDLSHNNIRIISPNHIKYLKRLVQLDVSHNHLRQFGESSLTLLSKLLILDLSHNEFQKSIVQSLQSLPTSLQVLNLANTNLSTIPSLSLPNLLELNFSMNQLTSLSAEMLINLSSIRVFDVSRNLLEELTNDAWHVLPYLQQLHLCGNPIVNISNDTFTSLNKLEELHIVNLPLQHIEINVFQPLTAIRTLEMNTYPHIQSYDLGQLIKENHVLSHVNLHVQETSFGNELSAKFPKSLNKITLQGNQLEILYPSLLNLMENKKLDLHIHNTNISELPLTFFTNLGKVSHLSMDVRNNNLRTMADFRMAQSSKKIHQLQLNGILLSGNPWQCDCNLIWINDWIKEQQYNRRLHIISDDKFTNNLRITECINTNQSIIEILKIKLNCYLSSQSNLALRNECPLYSIVVTLYIVFAIIFLSI